MVRCHRLAKDTLTPNKYFCNEPRLVAQLRHGIYGKSCLPT